MTDEEYIEKETYKFLGLTFEEARTDEFRNIFKLTNRIGLSLRKNIKNGTIKLEKQEDNFEALTSGDREMYFLGSLIKLRQDCDKLKNRVSI